MANNPYGAYQKQQDTAEDMRITEAKALLRMAALLEEVQQPNTDYLYYSDVLMQNQKLWTLFQASLAENATALPPQLSSILKGLSIYVDRRTLKAVGTQDPRMLNVLININKEIASGLMESLKRDMAQTVRDPSQAAASAPPPAMQKSGSIAEHV